jgi:hypothetical protein
MRQWISIRGPGGLRFGQSIGPEDFGAPKLPSTRHETAHGKHFLACGHGPRRAGPPNTIATVPRCTEQRELGAGLI